MYFSCSTYYIMSWSYTNTVDNEATTTNKRCTILVDQKVCLRLKELGIFGESFFGRLLDLLEERTTGAMEEAMTNSSFI